MIVKSQIAYPHLGIIDEIEEEILEEDEKIIKNGKKVDKYEKILT